MSVDLIRTLLAGKLQEELLEAAVLAGGRNSLVRRVGTVSGKRFVVKRYPDQTRLETEWRALNFLAANRVEAVPRPLALDFRELLAVYSFIEGRAPAGHDGSPEAVEPLISFLERLRSLRNAPGSQSFGPAAEALVDPSAIFRQVEQRLDWLREASRDLAPGLKKALRTFLDRQASPILARRAAKAGQPNPAPKSSLILSPSDFGFHNAVLGPEGELTFLDFEYFGWDDPAKLLVDTLLHPHERMRLNPPQRRRWLDRLLEIHYDDRQLLGRAEFFTPLLGLKWALILLNEFRPEACARRALAGWPPDSTGLIHQLNQAEKMLSRTDDLRSALQCIWD